jgi:hypothetical protein
MARQEKLKIDDRKVVKEIEEAAEAYVKARNERMLLTKEECKTRDALIKLMHDHKLKRYAYDGTDEAADGATIEVPRLIEIEKADEKIKVKNNEAKPPKGGDGEGDEENEPEE